MAQVQMRDHEVGTKVCHMNKNSHSPQVTLERVHDIDKRHQFERKYSNVVMDSHMRWSDIY